MNKIFILKKNHIPALSSFFVWQIVFYLQPALFNAFSLPQPTGFLFSPSDNVTIWFYYSEIPKHVLQQSWKIIRCCCGVKAHLCSMAPSGNYGIKHPKTLSYLSSSSPPHSHFLSFPTHNKSKQQRGKISVWTVIIIFFLKSKAHCDLWFLSTARGRDLQGGKGIYLESVHL